MIIIDVDPIAVRLGPLAISWYGMAMLAAVLVALALTLREARRKGLATGPIIDMALWVMIGGVVGARLMHVVDRWSYYAAHPLQIIAVQNGGLAILGGIIGGAAVVIFVCWRQGLPALRLFDVAAPAIVLGQAIGRFGCLINGDAVGPAVNGGPSITYLHPGAMAPQLGVAYQPTFLYEQIWDFAVFAVLWMLRRRVTTDGQLFALYLGLYGIGKFALTFLRTENVWFWGFQEAQLLSLGLIAAAVVLAAWSSARRPGARVQEAGS
jgi:phosphatidylglycerol---prolipoprotein diacylglyceryl transferase